MSVKLTREHVGIMKHTLSATRGLYCGDGKEMQELVGWGFMRSAGWLSFVPDEYFRITNAGRKALSEAVGQTVNG